MYTNHMPDGRPGRYYDDLNLIAIKKGLSAEMESEVIHHEYRHAWHHDRCSDVLAEARANREAAIMQVDVAEYRDAELISLDPRVIARELGVTANVVTNFQIAMMDGFVRLGRVR